MPLILKLEGKRRKFEGNWVTQGQKPKSGIMIDNISDIKLTFLRHRMFQIMNRMRITIY